MTAAESLMVERLCQSLARAQREVRMLRAALQSGADPSRVWSQLDRDSRRAMIRARMSPTQKTGRQG
jgi:hypothetical protein